nr:Unknown Function [uncultured bacterium]
MKKDHPMILQTIVDPSKVRPRLAPVSEEVVWHHELVGVRLIEAASVVRRLPMRTRPKEFGCAWPNFQAMTAGELQAFKNELMQSGGEGALLAWERDQNRVRIPPSGTEIERADEALGWFKYLRDDMEMAKIVGFWANTTYDVDVDGIPAIVRQGLRTISRGLRRDHVPARG